MSSKIILVFCMALLGVCFANPTPSEKVDQKETMKPAETVYTYGPTLSGLNNYRLISPLSSLSSMAMTYPLYGMNAFGAPIII